MDLRATIQIAHEALAERQVSHALIGGFALAVHGITRATADVDFLADGQRREAIREALVARGFELRFESPEVMQFGGTGLLDILLANRPLTRRMLNEALPAPRLPVRALRVEDLVGLKIQAYCNDRSRELRDKADIQALLAKHPGADAARIREYADLFGEWPFIAKLVTP